MYWQEEWTASSGGGGVPDNSHWGGVVVGISYLVTSAPYKICHVLIYLHKYGYR